MRPLETFARVPLGHFPTPLEPLDRLSAHLGGPRVWVKRDDCSGLGGGGNKARKLEFILAEARGQGADTLITIGATQSNHARMTAAAAARSGFRCILVLTDNVPVDTVPYRTNGNLLLDHLFGAEVLHCAGDVDGPAAMADVADRVRREGGRPYVIPLGGSSGVGELGYVSAAFELRDQWRAEHGHLEAMYVASGSGGTHAGLIAGGLLAGLSAEVAGIGISSRLPRQRAKVDHCLDECARVLEVERARFPAPVIDTEYIGAAYGVPTDAMIEAVRMVGRLEGLLLDPVYTGKTMAGLIGHVRAGRYAKGANVVFWHTGGVPALAAYPDVFLGEKP